MSEKQKGIGSLVLLAAVFAFMGVFVRFLREDFTLLQQIYLRIGMAVFLSLVFFFRALDFSKLKKITFKEWLLLLFRMLLNYGGVILFTQAVMEAKYSNVSFISSIPLTPILGMFLFKEKVNFKKISLILLAFAGVVLISVEDYSYVLRWGRGEILALVSALFFSFSYVARKWHSNLLSNKEMTTLMFGMGFVVLFLTSLAKGEGIPMTVSWNLFLVLIIFLAGLFNVMNLFLTNYGFQKVEAVIAGNILTLESAFALLIGFLFYKELPMMKELMGGIFIVISVILINMKQESKE